MSAKGLGGWGQINGNSVDLQCCLKLRFCEKDTKSEITTFDLSCVETVKSTVEILQNFVAFSEYMNFKISWHRAGVVADKGFCQN